MRRIQNLLLLIIGGISGVGGIGCQPKDPIVSVDFVELDYRVKFVINTQEAKKELERQAHNISGFEVRDAKRGERRWQLLARVAMATERPIDAEHRRRAMGVAVQLQELATAQRYSAEALDVRNVVKTASPTEQLSAALAQAIKRVNVSLKLARGDNSDLKRALEGDDDHARAEAVRLVRERKVVALRPELEAILEGSEANIQEVLKIAGALGELKQPESVPALIEAISKHREIAVPLVFVLGKIGGKQAEGFLFTVQSGHADQRIRAAAKEALSEMGFTGAAEN